MRRDEEYEDYEQAKRDRLLWSEWHPFEPSRGAGQERPHLEPPKDVRLDELELEELRPSGDTGAASDRRPYVHFRILPFSSPGRMDGEERES